MLGTPNFNVSQPAQLSANQTVSNSRDPAEGPVVFNYLFDFTALQTNTVDLTVELQQGRVSGVQTMFIDNSHNDAIVVMTMGGSSEPINVPAGAQMYTPIIAPMPSRLTVFSTGSGTAVYMALLNVPMPFGIWYPFGAGSNGLSYSGTDHSANAPAALANLLLTIAANPLRKGYSVQNQSAGTIQVVLDDGTSGGTTYLLATGGGANTQGGTLTFVDAPHRGRIRVFAAAAGDQVAAREW